MISHLSREEARKLIDELNAGLEDPMTRAMGASEHVTQAFRDKCVRLGTSPEEVMDLVFGEPTADEMEEFEDSRRRRNQERNEY